jgi:hypothetical protein
MNLDQLGLASSLGFLQKLRQLGDIRRASFHFCD